MRIRLLFGYLFFLMSIVFCAIQLGTLPNSGPLPGGPLLLQFSTSMVCLLLASLAAQSGSRTGNIAISVIAFSVCFLALLSGGILAFQGSSDLAALKYIILLAYAGFYGAFGLAFSFLTGPRPSRELQKNA